MEFGLKLAIHLAKELNVDVENVIISLDRFRGVPNDVNKKVRYDYDLLVSFCAENSIQLLKDYSNDRINRNTRIVAKCSECENQMVAKAFRELRENRNFGCVDCSTHFQQTKSKTTSSKNFGCENPSQNEGIKQKKKDTNMKNLGCEYSFQNEGVKQKIKETNMKNLGCEYPSQNEEVRQKIRDTNMKIYGCEISLQNENVKQKMRDTNMKRFGCENSLQNEGVRQKMRDTNMKRYGYENPFQNEGVKQKIKDTNLIKFGCEYPMQIESVKQKMKDTNIKRYGYEHAMQNPEFADKVSKTSYKSKDYTYPSGRVDRVQGYEPFALNELLQVGILETDIITQRSKVPEIWYSDNQKSRRYYVDIYIPSQNKCIEVKSAWTMKKKEDNVMIKQQAAINAGYRCEIWVYNGKGIKVLSL